MHIRICLNIIFNMQNEGKSPIYKRIRYFSKRGMTQKIHNSHSKYFNSNEVPPLINHFSSSNQIHQIRKSFCIAIMICFNKLPIYLFVTNVLNIYNAFLETQLNDLPHIMYVWKTWNRLEWNSLASQAKLLDRCSLNIWILWVTELYY